MKTSGFHFSNSFMDPVDLISTSGLERVGSGITTDSMSLWPTIRKISSSRYKGVVPQLNGRWGAQIYEKHHRIWLGTFSVESEAAKVYDIAALKFRGRDAGTNFKSSGEDPSQTWFLSLHSKVEIVDMLRRHTYNEEFSNAKQNQAKNISALDLTSIHDGEHSMLKKREELFTKIMMPSDVRRLNRLVVLKQHAEKYLPAMKREGMLLSFEDDGGRVWRFRYSYWRSSHSYVFTRGWSKFVKEKNLKPGDAVTFARSTGQDKLHYIFCTSSPHLHEFHHRPSVDQNCFLWKHLPQNDSAYSWLPHRPQTKASTPSQPSQNLVRLFGVDLHNTPPENTHASLDTNKRMRELELENGELYKRQRLQLTGNLCCSC